MDLENKLDILALLNSICFITLHIGWWSGKAIFTDISGAGVAMSFLLCMLLLFHIRKRAVPSLKKKLYRRIVNQSIFCLSFIILYILSK